jgi:hypothetical protein
LHAVEFITSMTFDEVRISIGSLFGSSNALDIYYAFASEAPLPVELIRFEGYVDGQDVLLRWTTATEEGNAGFAVQHRADPGQPWQEAAWISNAGTSLEAREYQHRVQGLSPGLHRFRLKQTDFDGTVTYSPEVEVSVSVPEGYRLSRAHPNPFNASASLSLSIARQQYVEASVFDVLGRRVAVLHRGVLGPEATHRLQFDAGSLPDGLYLVRVEGESFVTTERLVLSR